MKKTTPHYGEEFIGKPTFHVNLATQKIGISEPGRNVMLADLYIRTYREFDSFDDKIAQLEHLLQILRTFPDDSYFNNWLFDPERKKTEGNIIIRKKELEQTILAQLKHVKALKENNEVTDRNKEKTIIISKLYEIESVLDNGSPTKMEISRYKFELEHIIRSLIIKYSSSESFKTEEVLNEKTGKYSVRTIKTKKVIKFAEDLLDIVNERLQNFGL